MYETIKNNKKTNIIPSIILVCLAISLYESFAAVYLCGAVMLVILNYIYSDCSNEKTFKKNLTYGERPRVDSSPKVRLILINV
jgi:hypothetical protein